METEEEFNINSCLDINSENIEDLTLKLTQDALGEIIDINQRQIALIEAGKSKREDCKEVYDRAAILYNNAYIITDNDAIAKEYILRNREYIAKALLPSNLKKFNKIIDLITKNER